ncbi:MAG: hypothetical protein U0559_05145 [Anaerolineae bacterium]
MECDTEIVGIFPIATLLQEECSSNYQIQSSVRCVWQRDKEKNHGNYIEEDNAYGYNVMFLIGFDAFGLPAENAAIKRGVHPKTWTYANVDRMRKQPCSMGAMWDWEREAVSADPEYYKWTEWFFAQFFATGWLGENCRPSIGVPTATPRWPASKCGAMIATAKPLRQRP